MGLDYPHTCTDIDKNIIEFKIDIERNLSDMLEEYKTSLETEERDKLIEAYADCIYSDFEDSFENVRDTNMNMRDKANEQIAESEEAVKELEITVKKLERTVEELEERIAELQE